MNSNDQIKQKKKITEIVNSRDQIFGMGQSLSEVLKSNNQIFEMAKSASEIINSRSQNFGMGQSLSEVLKSNNQIFEMAKSASEIINSRSQNFGMGQSLSEALKSNNQIFEMAKSASEIINSRSQNFGMGQSLSEVLKSNNQIFEMAKSASEIINSRNQIFNMGQSAFEIINSRSQISEIGKTVSEVLSNIQTINYIKDLNSSIQELDSFQTTLAKFEIQNKFDNQTRVLSKKITKLSETISEKFINPDDYISEGFEITENHTISFPPNNDYDHKLLTKLKEILNKYDSKTINIEHLMYEIRSLKDTKIQKLMNLIFYPLIISVAFNIIGLLANGYLEKEILKYKPFIRKYISFNLANQIEEREMSKFYRFVDRELLYVKQNNYLKSKTIYTLKFGEIVILISKRKDWSLIQKKDTEGNVIIEGWVLSRYLEK